MVDDSTHTHLKALAQRFNLPMSKVIKILAFDGEVNDILILKKARSLISAIGVISAINDILEALAPHRTSKVYAVRIHISYDDGTSSIENVIFAPDKEDQKRRQFLNFIKDY